MQMKKVVEEDMSVPVTCCSERTVEEEEEPDMVLDSSVDCNGNVPLRSKTGAWKAALFIVVFEFSERMSYYGLSANLIIYLTKVLRQDVTTGAKNANYWTGVTTMMPLLGGFVADSYLGRFTTVVVSSLIYILGLGLLTVSELVPSLRPGASIKRHEALFFASIYLISIGTGGHKPALESFGADQFDGHHTEERRKKMSFFNWWNVALCGGVIVGVTVIVYVQDNVSWATADVILAMTMTFSLVLFCVGRPYYRYRLPEGSFLTPLLQVVVAAVAKRHLPPPSNPMDLYEIPTSNKRLLCHTDKLRFLDKAAIIETKEEANEPRRNNWRLATVTQVEELKLVVGVIPIWLTTQAFALVMAQGSTFFIKQSSTMDRRITSSFQIPPASIFILSATGMMTSVTIYDRIIVPYLRSVTGNERGMSFLKRIGIGMMLSVLAVMVAAVVERKRLRLAEVERSKLVSMSVFWLAPQFVILGFADGFTLVGLQEYFYEQMPDNMRSLGIGFYLSVTGSANFLSSVLISVVDAVTKKTSSDGRSWFGNDLNSSRLDYFYWLLAVLGGVNVFVYALVVTSSKYVPGGGGNKITVQDKVVVNPEMTDQSGAFEKC